MSKPASRFSGLSARLPEAAAPPPAQAPTEATTPAPSKLPARSPVEKVDHATASTRSKGRIGKKLIAGHFSDELSRQLRTLAAAEDTTVQALMGEAFDLLMRARGKHPLGER